MDKIITVDIIACPRCGGDHTPMMFAKLLNPIEIDKAVYNYWATCGKRGEPVLLATAYSQFTGKVEPYAKA